MANSANRPEKAKYGTIYFIRHNSGALKIGITLDWNITFLLFFGVEL